MKQKVLIAALFLVADLVTRRRAHVLRQRIEIGGEVFVAGEAGGESQGCVGRADLVGGEPLPQRGPAR